MTTSASGESDWSWSVRSTDEGHRSAGSDGRIELGRGRGPTGDVSCSTGHPKRSRGAPIRRRAILAASHQIADAESPRKPKGRLVVRARAPTTSRRPSPHTSWRLCAITGPSGSGKEHTGRGRRLPQPARAFGDTSIERRASTRPLTAPGKLGAVCWSTNPARAHSKRKRRHVHKAGTASGRSSQASRRRNGAADARSFSLSTSRRRKAIQERRSRSGRCEAVCRRRLRDDRDAVSGRRIARMHRLPGQALPAEVLAVRHRGRDVARSSP